MRNLDASFALTQPLISRPGYGQGGSPALPRGSVSESKLPSGPPAQKGLSLDKDIPGSSTFNKPEDDIREFDKAEDGSIYRIDGPDDRAKKQNDPEGDERHHEQFKPTYAPPGGRGHDDVEITKYPYRDGVPNAHNASVEFVAGLYALESAPELYLPPCASYETRTAAKMDEILGGLNPKVLERSNKCSTSLKRSDIPNLRWIFAVNCGNGVKVVRMKATRPGNAVKLGRMELHLSCSCPAWRWLGSEHHSKQETYLDGAPRGTASVPVIKDPEMINRVCKHVAAALSLAKRWEVPIPKKKPGIGPKTASAEDLYALVQRAAELAKKGIGLCPSTRPNVPTKLAVMRTTFA